MSLIVNKTQDPHARGAGTAAWSINESLPVIVGSVHGCLRVRIRVERSRIMAAPFA